MHCSYLETVIKFGDNNHCPSKCWVNFANRIQPQWGAPLNTTLLEEQEYAVRRTSQGLHHRKDFIRRVIWFTLLCLQYQISFHEYNPASINAKPNCHKFQALTLRTNPGVSIIVRLGQCAYSALITIGLGETAVLVFFKSASVRDFIMSAMADAKTTGLPYSSESSSCVSNAQ